MKDRRSLREIFPGFLKTVVEAFEARRKVGFEEIICTAFECFSEEHLEAERELWQRLRLNEDEMDPEYLYDMPSDYYEFFGLELP